MNTKEKILQTALELFNETNTQAATTNHIAKAMNISAGNLHYHYKNREEIIRLLYIQMMDKVHSPINDIPETIVELSKHLEVISKVTWEYRFFHRELLFLLSRDKKLEELYIKDNIAHKKRIVQSFRNFIHNGDLEIAYENVIDTLADSVLMHLQFWNPLMFTLGKELNKETFDDGVNRIQELFRPFLTKKALKELAELEK